MAPTEAAPLTAIRAGRPSGLVAGDSLVSTGERGVFRARDSRTTWGLWASGGTLEGTERIRGFRGRRMTIFGTGDSVALLIHRSRRDGGAGRLWISDGTREGKTPVTDRRNRPLDVASEGLGDLALTHNRLLFMTTDDGRGRELWSVPFAGTSTPGQRATVSGVSDVC